MRDSYWASPDKFFLSLRCTRTDYAQQFVEKGQIKFSTPQNWVDWEITSGKQGRGDLREGTIAYHHILDLDKFFELSNKYGAQQIYGVCIDERVHIKQKRSMNLPAFCIYTLKNRQFDCPCKVGKHEIRTTIPATYFRDFADNLTDEEVNNLPIDKRPAIVIIRNFNEVKKRLINKLILMGISRTEILDGHVLYTHFNEYGKYGWCDFGKTSPMELFLKDESFCHQSEGRIIINTNNQNLINRLDESPIEIGSLEDIAEYKSVYLSGGAEIIANVDIQVAENGYIAE